MQRSATFKNPKQMHAPFSLPPRIWLPCVRLTFSRQCVRSNPGPSSSQMDALGESLFGQLNRLFEEDPDISELGLVIDASPEAVQAAAEQEREEEAGQRGEEEHPAGDEEEEQDEAAQHGRGLHGLLLAFLRFVSSVSSFGFFSSIPPSFGF